MLTDNSAPHSSESVGLLATFASSESEAKQPEPEPEPAHRKSARNCLWFGLVSLLLISLLCNGIQAGYSLRGSDCVPPPIGGLRTDQHHISADEAIWTDMSNMTALDKLWDGMNVDTGVVQLPRDARLGDTQTFPWDPSRGLYMLESYHTLHCLKNIYAYVRIRQRGETGGPTAGHVFHCLADIRSSVLCDADDTVLPFRGKQKFAVAAPERKCRSWERLEGWAVEHSACFARREDDDPLHETLAEYVDCPPGSPYRGVVQELRMGDA
ncbi:hypothetical protein ANO14919_050630 [Xylariales sp. No.14919]|nr:hypothetical protein ANO14919_050630 [Xylariales sp. No.14919]